MRFYTSSSSSASYSGVAAGKSCSFNLVMNIHDRIKKARADKGLSMEQLAAAVGVKSWQTIQQWENGKTAPSRKRMEIVASVLGLPIEELAVGASTSQDWPFTLIDEVKFRALSQRDKDRIEAALVAIAHGIRIDVTPDMPTSVRTGS